MKNCIFCKIIKHQVSASIIYEDELVTAILDTDPISEGHTLIIPKKHIRDINTLDSKTGKRIIEIAKRMTACIEQEFKFDGSMLMASSGIFQDIPHFHLHIFGRNKKNDIQFSYPKNINANPEHISENTNRLKTKLNFKS